MFGKMLFFYVVHLFFILLEVRAGVLPTNLEAKPIRLRTLGNGPTYVDGQLHFDDTLEVEIDDETDGKELYTLQRQRIEALEDTSYRNSVIYRLDGRVIVMQDCGNGADISQCKQYALVKKGDGATYVNSEGKTMKLPQRFGEVGAVDSDVIDPSEVDIEDLEDDMSSSFAALRDAEELEDTNASPEAFNDAIARTQNEEALDEPEVDGSEVDDGGRPDRRFREEGETEFMKKEETPYYMQEYEEEYLGKDRDERMEYKDFEEGEKYYYDQYTGGDERQEPSEASRETNEVVETDETMEDYNLDYGGSDFVRTRLGDLDKEAHGGRRRFKRDINTARVIKLLIFADKTIVDRFLVINNNNMTAAREDIVRFLTLMCNSMTMHYQTLKEYGLTMSVNGKPEKMNIAIALVGVQFPSENEVFGNYEWIEQFHSGGKLLTYMQTGFSRRLGRVVTAHAGALMAFRRHMLRNKDTYKSVAFDHAMTLTGYDLKQKIYVHQNETEKNLLGIAFTGSMCKVSARDRGLHLSIIEFNNWVIRTAAHELGHAFGISHDFGGECPSGKFLMSANSFLPGNTTEETFFKFSKCSAKNVENFTKSINGSDFVETCLQSPDEAFRGSYCKGFVGEEVSLDDQCVLHFGNGSRRAHNRNLINEIYQRMGYVTHCIIKDRAFANPFWCSRAEFPTTTFILPEAAPGTKCVLEGKTEQNNVCYHGQCVQKTDLC